MEKLVTLCCRKLGHLISWHAKKTECKNEVLDSWHVKKMK